MKHKRSALALGVLFVLTAPGLPATDDYWRTLPYERLHDALSSVRSLEGARYIRVDRKIATTAPDIALADVRMVIASASGDIVVGIAEDGTLDFPMNETLLEENPGVRVNVPDGQLSINVEINFDVPASRSFPYTLITELEDEYRRFTRAQGMLARMMAPDMEALAARFADGEPATATVSAPVEVTLEADSEHRILVPIDEGWAGSEIVFSRVPDSMEPVFED